MQRVIHFSNRVDIPKSGVATAGGLDETIAVPPFGTEILRIGWSGRVIEDALYDPATAVHDVTVGAVRYITFDFSETMERRFYSGMANNFLWPLFHGRADLAKDGFSHEDVAVYDQVNGIFADLAKQYATLVDTFVIHDYHLIPLGHMCQQAGLRNPMAYFLHIPVPDFKTLLSCGQDITRHVCGLFQKLRAYDLIGVQSRRDYNAMMMIFNLGNTWAASGKQNFFVNTAKVSVLPVVGNTPYYVREAERWKDAPETEKFISEHGNPDIVSVDRLDYSKGLPNKFRALEIAHEKSLVPADTHFLQIAPMGRQNVPAYVEEARLVDKAYASLREKFGAVATLYKDKVRRELILGLFRRSRLGLVTPIKDGMNLVALEYIAAQSLDNPGVLVLSTQAGAAQLFSDSALMVDANDPDHIAEAIGKGLHMSLEERQARHRTSMAMVNTNTNQRWQMSLIRGAQAGARNRPSNMRHSA